jgi:putative PIN family toxin of toxin-antitoxin system
VLDTNVWISYIINGELEWLGHYVVQNKLLIYASPLLLAEIKKVLQYARVKKLLNAPPAVYMNVIIAIVLLKEDIPTAIKSPDPDDDYVFELAISNSAKAIICGDKPLLNWEASPIKVISKKEFEMLY